MQKNEIHSLFVAVAAGCLPLFAELAEQIGGVAQRAEGVKPAALVIGYGLTCNLLRQSQYPITCHDSGTKPLRHFGTPPLFAPQTEEDTSGHTTVCQIPHAIWVKKDRKIGKVSQRDRWIKGKLAFRV